MSIKENLRLEINNYKTIYIRFNLIEGFSLETMGLTLWNTEAFFQKKDKMKYKIRRAILKKENYSKYNQFHISATKAITKDCLSLQCERSV